MRWIVASLIVGLGLGCSEPQSPQNWISDVVFQDSSIGVMMALDVYNDSAILATGQNGRFAWSSNTGESWKVGQVPEADSMQLRSMYMLDDYSYVVATAGQPAQIFKTVDRGENWRLVYQDTTGKAFLDAMLFFNGAKGVVYGDAIDECPSILITEDSGESWRRVSCERLPEAITDEAGYAASNSLITSFGREVWVATSSADTGRVLRSSDFGETWTAGSNPLPSDTIAGAMGIRFFDANRGILVGGDWTHPQQRKGTVAYTADGGASWTTPENPPGHLADLVYLPRYNGKVVIAGGQSGLWQSNDAGATWNLISEIPIYTIETNAIGTQLITTGKGEIRIWKMEM